MGINAWIVLGLGAGLLANMLIPDIFTWLTAIAGAAILLLACHLVTSRTTRTRRRSSHEGWRSRRWAHR